MAPGKCALVIELAHGIDIVIELVRLAALVQSQIPAAMMYNVRIREIRMRRPGLNVEP